MIHIPTVRQKSFPRILAACCVVGCLFLSIGCRGYNVGNQFLHRSDIRTVHVSMLESNSFRPFLGQRVTEAIIKEIELNTPLTITEPAIANSFITGRLVRDTKRVRGRDRADEPRDIQLDWQLEITWMDRAGVPLMQRQLLKLTQNESFIPEGGQSISTAQQELINRIAREVVGQMEVPW